MTDFTSLAIDILSDSHTWLITGHSGGGKEQFFAALQSDSTALVSLEAASALIEEERKNDDSEFIEGGVDIGRTAASYIAEVLHGDNSSRLEYSPEVQLCGIQSILNRGLKYLSTGEMRRTLLCRALLSRCNILLLSEPFAGLDAQSRRILFDFFDSIAAKRGRGATRIVLCTERYNEIPPAITHVLEFFANEVSFCGNRTDYEATLERRAKINARKITQKRAAFLAELDALSVASAALASNAGNSPAVCTQTEEFPVADEFSAQTENSRITEQSAAKSAQSPKIALVCFKNVNVAWGEKKVLDNINWTLYEGEHWLIRGPNGSGKTTLLELITGDNTQVYCNDVTIFSRRRGTGETIWDIKEKLGIVSYRLHLEYRMVGGTDLEAVILSGFHDSIGLYQPRSPVEQAAAQKWLNLAGFNGREKQSFSRLSYGEQRALLIIRAAVKSAPILILDEPCHGLDEEWRTKILDLMDRVAESGTSTLLHVTHDLTEVRSFEKHILELQPDKSPMYRIISV